MKRLLIILTVLLLFGPVAIAQNTPAKGGSNDKLKKSRDEFVRATNEYKESLKQLIALYEKDVINSQNRLKFVKELASEGLASQHSVEEAEQAVLDAQNKLADAKIALDKADKRLREFCITSAAPKLRGFTLGQTPEEIETRLPGFTKAFYNALSNRTDRDIVIVNSVPLFYRQPGKRWVPDPDFEDVDFFWHFYKHRLYFMTAQYREYDPPNIQNFIQQVTEKTGLPVNGWILPDKYHAILSCNEFKVELWTGRILGRSYYKDFPSVTLTDMSAYNEIVRRRKEEADREANIERERRRQAEERLRQEQEKRKIFRP